MSQTSHSTRDSAGPANNKISRHFTISSSCNKHLHVVFKQHSPVIVKLLLLISAKIIQRKLFFRLLILGATVRVNICLVSINCSFYRKNHCQVNGSQYRLLAIGVLTILILNLMLEKKGQKQLGFSKFHSDNVISIFIFNKPFRWTDINFNPFDHLQKIWHWFMCDYFPLLLQTSNIPSNS